MLPTRIRDKSMKKLSVFSLILSTIMLFSCKGTNQDAPQEVIDTVPPIPYITEKGIEPFVLGASLYDIPVKGSFYDTIILEKLYDWYEYCGEGAGKGYSEDDFKSYNRNKTLKELIDDEEIIVSRCYAVARILKDKDTLIKAEINAEDAKICSIDILSSLFQLENGIHVGMGAPELVNKYNAIFMGQNEYAEEYKSLSSTVLINIPSLPKNITVYSYCEGGVYETLHNYFSKKVEKAISSEEIYYDGQYDYEEKIPTDIAKGITVTSISIH